MIEQELIPIIRQLIKQELTPILMGKIQSTADVYRAGAKRFSNENEVQNMRLLSPYGLVSRPKKDTECVVMPIGGDATHLNVLTQFDKERPEISEEEVCLYGPQGQVVYMKAGNRINIGALDASEAAVLGNVLKSFLSDFLDAFLNAPKIGDGGSGPVFLAGAVRSNLVSQKSQYLNTASTNILSQRTFVERGT